MCELLVNPSFFAVAVFECVIILIKSCHLGKSEGLYQGFLELEKRLLREQAVFEVGCLSLPDGDVGTPSPNFLMSAGTM